jgi:hypothetical protein
VLHECLVCVDHERLANLLEWNASFLPASVEIPLGWSFAKTVSEVSKKLFERKRSDSDWSPIGMADELENHFVSLALRKGLLKLCS